MFESPSYHFFCVKARLHLQQTRRSPDDQPDNLLSHLHSPSNPGSIIDVEILENRTMLTLFPHWLKLVNLSGNLLSSIKLQKKAISLGRYQKEFVVCCNQKTLYFIRIIDSHINIYHVMHTKIQFSGAYAVSTNALHCVAQDEPTIYVYNGRMCTKTIDLTAYTMPVRHSRSSRRI